MTHAGSQHAILGGGVAAALNVTEDGDAGIETQLLADLLAHCHGRGCAFRHHDHEVSTAAKTGLTDLIGNVFIEIILRLRYEDGGSAGGKTHIEGEIACVATHDLHHGAALVGLHGVAEAVDALHGGVGGGVETDGIVGADDVVINGAGDAHHGDAVTAQILCAAERTVAADGDNTVEAQQLTGGGGLLLPLLGAELVTAGGVENGAAAVDDAADAGGVHLHKVAGNKTLPAAANTDDLDTTCQGTADNRADSGIHAGGVTAGGEDANSLHCILHSNLSPS